MVPGLRNRHHSILHNDQKLLRRVRSLVCVLRFLLGSPTFSFSASIALETFFISSAEARLLSASAFKFA
jgi:hypothetical protein